MYSHPGVELALKCSLNYASPICYLLPDGCSLIEPLHDVVSTMSTRLIKRFYVRPLALQEDIGEEWPYFSGVYRLYVEGVPIGLSVDCTFQLMV